MAENLNADRYAMALVVRTAVWGQPEDLTRLRPQARRGASPATTADEDAAFAAALAAFGYIEVKDDE